MIEQLFTFTGGIALIVVAVVFYAVIRVGFKSKPRKEVLLLRPRDRRGETLPVTKETDRSLTCGKSNPIHRFIKLGPGYSFHDSGKLVTRFWGIEGTAYTADLATGKLQGPLSDYLREIAWDPDFYDRLPDDRKKAIETAKSGIIVEPVSIDEESYGLPTLTGDDVNDEGDSVLLQRIAQGTKQSTAKREFYQLLTGVLIGFGLAAILLRLGVF